MDSSPYAPTTPAARAPLKGLKDSVYAQTSPNHPPKTRVSSETKMKNALVMNEPHISKAEAKPLEQEGSLKLLPHKQLRSRLEACATPTSTENTNTSPPIVTQNEDQEDKVNVPQCRNEDSAIVVRDNRFSTEASLSPIDQTKRRPVATSVYSSKPAALPLRTIEGLSPSNEPFPSKSPFSNGSCDFSNLEESQQRVMQFDNTSSFTQDDGELPSGPSSDELNPEASHQIRFSTVAAWRERITPGPCVARFEEVESNKYDIDTVTGQLYPGEPYPESYPHPDSAQSDNSLTPRFKFRGLDAESIIRIVLNRRTYNNNNRLMNSAVVKYQPSQKAEEEANWPSAGCLLRPAKPSDFRGIAAIMNEDIKDNNTPQVYGSQEVQPVDVQKVYDECINSGRPFIVALPSKRSLLSKVKCTKEFQREFLEFLEFKKAQMAAMGDGTDTILGFAFVTDGHAGVFEGALPSARFAGKIVLAVRSSQRQKNYGSALLDRILLCVAVYHRSLVDYEWQCIQPRHVYELQPTKNYRKYARVYLETIFSGSDDPNIEWITRMLKRFEFNQAGYLQAALTSGSGFDRQWFDLALWEHKTQPPQEITD